MKGKGIEKFNDEATLPPIQEPGYFYVPYTPSGMTEFYYNNRNPNLTHNLIDRTKDYIRLVVNNLHAARNNSSKPGQGSRIAIRCPRTGIVHELEFLGSDGWWYFLTTRCIERQDRPTEYLRINHIAPGRQISRAVFRSREKIIQTLISQTFYIESFVLPDSKEVLSK